MANKVGLTKSAGCSPEAEQIMFLLAIGEVGEPYANDTSLKISVQFNIPFRRTVLLECSKPMQ